MPCRVLKLKTNSIKSISGVEFPLSLRCVSFPNLHVPRLEQDACLALLRLSHERRFDLYGRVLDIESNQIEDISGARFPADLRFVSFMLHLL